MAYIEWNDSLSVRVGVFDDDHRQLVSIINKLHLAILMKETQNVMKDILASLAVYTMEHFKHEEDLMVKYSYPEYFPHKKEHDALLKKVNDFRKSVESGETVVSFELMAFLKDWLVNHILSVDVKYSDFFKGREMA